MDSKVIYKNKIQKTIEIKGAEMHNLKAIDISIPKKQLVVITGLSGSGKSSLAFDTIYAEGQRRFIESLSSYARQFLGKLNKPKVKSIDGLSPAIAIEQRVNNSNPRSTVGTSSEIYEYIKLLYARVGKTISPKSGDEIKKDSINTVLDFIKKLKVGDKFLIMIKLEPPKDIIFEDFLSLYSKQGFVRIEIDEKILSIEDFDNRKFKNAYLVIDRSIFKNEENYLNRIVDSIENAFNTGNGSMFIKNLVDNSYNFFTKKFQENGVNFLEPNEHLFSFNNPYGACSKCGGYGDIMGIDPELVVPNTSLSIYEECIAPWRGQKLKKYNQLLTKNAHLFDFPIHRPYFKLSKEQKELLWTGNEYFKGIDFFFKKLEQKMYKIQNRVMLSRYRGRTLCSDCKGKRLREEASYVKVNGRSITELVDMPISKLLDFFNKIKFKGESIKKSERLLKEIISRLKFAKNVGLGYLTLNRKSNSLSGGETQRINLATSLGSALVGSIYVLDEPSVGLHPEDTLKLIDILLNLKKIGNSVIIVEHDEDIIRSADHIIDLGPGAGSEGGEIVAEGTIKNLLESKSLTSSYLNGSLRIEIPKSRKKIFDKISLIGCRENNLKNINVVFPLNMMVCVTGLSGSGKTTLVKNILYPALLKNKGVFKEKPGQFNEIKGDLDKINSIEYIDQNPIGQSSRSNPATYIKVYDDIRALFSNQKTSKHFGLKPKHFSFNVDGGRCDECKGEGTVKIEMQFMSDIILKCESCKGKRFKNEVLKVRYDDMNIDNILNMTIQDAYNFFSEKSQKRIANKLKSLLDVGMGYVKLGQSSSTLSGGEAQRIKLASFLLKGNNKENTLFIFDEPTTGLHIHDIKKLIKSFNLLIEFGHSIIVVEHNLDLIKSSDYIIDLGPYGGDEGGSLVFEGTPEDLIKDKKSLLANHLRPKLSFN
jgi:excinuclease ABC subunit A|tara:strand:- start:246 stop:3038 length:2793 start_codon:yes stop_codon:yes gene_type:complete